MFGDHMILQRNMPVPVWGQVDPGESVEVRFAGHQVTTKADPDGRWKAVLPALEASATGRDLTIHGSHTVTFKDVLVGEVWICSGQSNMQYGWGKASHPMFHWGGNTGLETLEARARKLPIRTFHVPVNISFTPLNETTGTWTTEPPGSAVAFGFSTYLQKALDVPVATIVTCWGSSFIEGWMPLDLTAELPHFKERVEKMMSHETTVARINSAINKGVRPGGVFVRKQPNLLYNAMLHPVIPYACRGMVWYQGEANANQPERYAKSLPLWLQRIRKEWRQKEFHLLAVMLPGYGKDNGHPDSDSWAWFREAQMQVLRIPGTSVVNTIDLGDADEIHPPDKQPICRRLSLLAQQDVYGKSLLAKGPVFRRFHLDGSEMVIEFDHSKGLKTIDGLAPAAFWLGDQNGNWHPAMARIQNNRVVLKSEKVTAPSACRYAFSGKPQVNLVNEAGLPAYPFRTDQLARGKD